MIRTARTSVRLATLSIAAVVAVFGGLSLTTVNSARQAERWLAHTEATIDESRALLASMVDAETGERGYLISGDEIYLAPYREAQIAVPQHFARMKELTVDNPAQQARLERVEDLLKTKLQIIRDAGDARGHGRAVPLIDKVVMDKLRVSVNLFEEEENKIFRMRASTLDERYVLILGCLGLFTLFIAAGTGFGIRKFKEIEVRARAAEDMAQQTQKMDTIGQLSGGIAHDFNNILQAVMTNLDLASRKLGPDQAASNFIQTAMAGLEKGAKLTGQLLSFARRQPLRPEPVAVDRVLGDVVDFLGHTLGEKYQVEVIGSAGLWRALIDQQLLQNAILNLALNARDAMPEGGKLTLETANVMLDARYAESEREVTPGQYVMVAVSDTGTGMSADIVARVFEPFFTTKTEGTGLGLAMVYGFIKQSQGHVKIYSESGHGTTVKMYLPRTTKDEKIRADADDKVIRGDGRTILVVEDDDGVRAGAVTQLSDLGYKVVAASDGQSALDIIGKDPGIDLLFTDVVLVGGLNGRQLADRARQIRPNLAIVYTSGYTENAIIHHGRLDEGAILLSKPYRGADLARVIGGALAGNAAVADLATAVRGQANAASDAASRTILVVEDNEMVRMGLVMALENMAHRVMATATATEALAILNGGRMVDLLISDLGLPDLNGLGLAEAARERIPMLDIIIASGSPPLREEIHCLDGPPLRWLLKPFTAEQWDCPEPC